MEQEIWKPIKGFECFYEISNLGRVRSVDRIVERNGNEMFIKSKVKRLCIKGGYYYVTLYINGVCKHKYIHQLVAETFIPNPQNKPCIDHINTNRLDNRIENLRWVTRKENNNNPQTLLNKKKIDKVEMANKIRHALTQRKRVNAPRKVNQYDANGDFVQSFPSLCYTEKALGISRHIIKYAIINHRCINGYTFRFAD